MGDDFSELRALAAMLQQRAEQAEIEGRFLDVAAMLAASRFIQGTIDRAILETPTEPEPEPKRVDKPKDGAAKRGRGRPKGSRNVSAAEVPIEEKGLQDDRTIPHPVLAGPAPAEGVGSGTVTVHKRTEKGNALCRAALSAADATTAGWEIVNCGDCREMRADL